MAGRDTTTRGPGRRLSLSDTCTPRDDFRGKNAAVAVRHVLHGLYNAYDKKTAQKKLKNVWPVKPGETDKEFRGAIASWITTLQENHSGSSFLQGFSAALLLRPGTPQCSMFLALLSGYVLQDRLKDKLELAGDAVPLNVLKFATQQDVSSRVALQRELTALEAENVELERGLKKCSEFCSKFLQGYDKKASQGDYWFNEEGTN
ncbi:hypothetical protein HPB50_011208 [Hyalomma asiaticum]|uniref:Uncharacterized protein n=1 Tax=Hyalomma asiaticum TaxID=266040 RepID=A0ACB7SXS3_HYAAI|nr:hypothetical protein HPB50_011208 [Hyalomma asiaticum]